MPPLRTYLRAYLGTDLLLPRLESHMSEITDALNKLATQVNAVSAAQASSFHNLQVAIDELKAGKLDTEQKEIVGRIEAALTKLGEDAQAGDNGYEPIEAPAPVEDETPVVSEPGPAIPADPTGMPADETPTGPVEGQPVPDESATSRKRSH